MAMNRARQEILTTAGYHPAGLYAFGKPVDGGVSSTQGKDAAGLLTFYSGLEVNADSLSDQFVPLSATAQHGRNPKIFAVGILPPNQNVTGRLLDRSESVAREESRNQPVDVNSGASEDGKPLPEGFYPNPPVAGTANNNLSKGDAPADQLDSAFWAQFVAMARRLGQDPENLAAVISLESRFDPSAQNIQNGRVVAQGLNQYTRASALDPNIGGMTEDEWNSMADLSAEEQLVYVERYFRHARPKPATKGQLYRLNFGGFNNPDGSLYASKAAQEAYIAEHPGAVFPKAEYQQKAIEQNPAFVVNGKINLSTLESKVANLPPRAIRAYIAEASNFIDSGGQIEPLPVLGDAESTADWQGSGNKDAQAARLHSESLENTELRFPQADLLARQDAQVKAIQNALSAMAATPPLRMLVNPNKFAVKSSKIVQDGNWGRNGPIIEFWGDDQDKISGSGRVAGFYALDTTLTHGGIQDSRLGRGGPGLTRAARNFSQSWQNFQALWLLYKNNGGMYLSETLSQKNRDFLLSTVGSVYIYYDNILYFGSFDSFNITETDDKPFTVDYSFEFTVRASFLLDLPPDFDGAGANLVRTRRSNIPTDSRFEPDSPIVQQYGAEGAADYLVSRGADNLLGRLL